MPPYDYDDDDLEDYAGDDYYDEEYDDELMQAVEDVKELIAFNKSISDDQIKEAIDNFDFDVDRAADYLLKQLEKEKQKKEQKRKEEEAARKAAEQQKKAQEQSKETGGATGTSKLAKLAQMRAQSTRANSGSNEGTTGAASPPLSKLAVLSKARSSGSSPTPLRALAGSSKAKEEVASAGSSPVSRSSFSSSPEPAKPSSKLAELARMRAQQVSSGQGRTSPMSVSPASSETTKLSAIEMLRNSRMSASQPPPRKKQALPKKRVPVFPSVDYGAAAATARTGAGGVSELLGRAGHQFRMLSAKVANSVFMPAAEANASRDAFSKPSPDDVVLAAQEGGFAKKSGGTGDLAADVGKLKIADTPKSNRKVDIQHEMSKSKDKKRHVGFVVIGHVDAGKSTLMGRMLYDAGAVDKHLVEKYKRESSTAGKGSFAFAWVMDQTAEERNRGVTIDIAASDFETSTTKFTIIDAPGHRDFVPNMIAGSSQAECAVLVVDAATDAFEAGFDLDGQTKEHAILARSLGVEHIVVAVNKLDTVAWSQDRFDEIRVQLNEFLSKTVGFDKSRISFVPTSGLGGDNVVHASTNAPWYKGPTLLGTLETAQVRSKEDLSTQDLRMIVADAYSAAHTSDVSIVGRIDTGGIQVGETVSVFPSGANFTVKAITSGTETRQWEVATSNVTLTVSGLALDDIAPGDVVTNVESPVPLARRFRSRLVVFDVKRPLLQGSKVILHRGRTNEPCTVSKIEATIDKATGEVLKKKPRHLGSGKTAIVEITLAGDTTIPAEAFKKTKTLGRFVLRNEGSTLAAGVVDEIID